eukprot:8506840-Pyramimonas_sp.AAC.1
MRGAGAVFETVALAETHVKLSGMEAARAELFKDGWKMVGTPASASASSSSGPMGWRVGCAQEAHCSRLLGAPSPSQTESY